MHKHNQHPAQIQLVLVFPLYQSSLYIGLVSVHLKWASFKIKHFDKQSNVNQYSYINLKTCPQG